MLLLLMTVVGHDLKSRPPWLKFLEIGLGALFGALTFGEDSGTKPTA
jgi:hypothetical protein